MKIAGHVRIWLGILFSLLFLVPVALTAEEALKRIQDEADSASRAFGQDRTNNVTLRANAAYRAIVVGSGLQRFIDKGYTEKEELRTTGVMDKQQRSFAVVFNGYVESMSVQLYGLFFRGAIMVEWLFFIGLFLLGAIVDGVIRRKVKLATGGVNSPVKFTWSMHILVFLTFSPFVYLMLPMAITPMFMPYWTVLAALPLTIAIANAVRVT